MGWLSIALAILKEGLAWARISAQAHLEQDEALRKTKMDMLDAAKKSIASGDTSHIIDLADKLRASGS